MPRKADPIRRVEILDAVVDYIAERGIGDLSLRPVAKALGQSTFVLTYHFGDRDGLITAALEHFEAKQRELVKSWSRLHGRGGIATTMRRYWRAMLSQRNQRLIRFGFEIASSPAGWAFGPRITSDWVTFLAARLSEAGLVRAEAQREATLLVATMNGLLFDLMATGDRRRIEGALDLYAERLEGGLTRSPT